MDWQSISEEDIWDEINSACVEMTRKQENLWDFVKIIPEKWAQNPWGNEGGGFWVVALFADQVIWYNDIEEGFNRSSYKRQGIIDEYRCNENSLVETIMWLETEIAEGRRVGHVSSGPLPGAAPGHPDSFNPDS